MNRDPLSCAKGIQSVNIGSNESASMIQAGASQRNEPGAWQRTEPGTSQRIEPGTLQRIEYGNSQRTEPGASQRTEPGIYSDIPVRKAYCGETVDTNAGKEQLNHENSRRHDDKPEYSSLYTFGADSTFENISDASTNHNGDDASQVCKRCLVFILNPGNLCLKYILYVR